MNNLGVQVLLSRILSHMTEGPKYFTKDTLTNRDERFFSAEIIRESIFHSYKDEVPYSCEVVIESFKDKNPQLSVIDASIVVSKDTQKAILIGKGGIKLKELGIHAREKLEKFLDRKVFLALHVKVDEDWRMKDDALTKYGYIESDFG
jgi:GTPase